MKNPRGSIEKPENNENCRLLAPFVMALFDGEADENEARRARAHLLVCQTCARRWLDWNRARDLLQSAPVAAPPPQLVWRVLMACRLTREPQRDASRLPNPADITGQILARTTRAPQSFAPRRTFSPLKVSTLAVPALAAWMMVLQRDSWLPMPVASTSGPVVFSAAPPDSVERIVQRDSASRGKERVTSRAVPATRFAFTKEIVERRPQAVRGESTGARNLAVRLDSASRPQNFQPTLVVVNAAVERKAPPVIIANFNQQPRRSFSSAPQVPVAARETEREILAPQRALPVDIGAPVRTLTARLTRGSAQSSAPRMRTTRWRRVSPPVPVKGAPIAPKAQTLSWNGATDSPQSLRVSLPSASAPQPTRLLAENFDADDAHIEEIRTVVEDFRATLGSDGGSSGESFASDEGTAG